MGLESLNFDKGNGLIPVIVQDAENSVVLMLGYMNSEALEKTEKTGKVTFFSRSKGRLWTKGETSGNYLMVSSIAPDCDLDTLLIKAKPVGPVCHTGKDTCFGDVELSGLEFLRHLQDIISDRKANPKSGSYTTSLFEKGVNKIAQKVGEEAVELVIEAKDDNKELFKNEAADLLYHYMILLEEKGERLEDIIGVLQERHSNK